jgi:hypothetical protein
MKRLFSVFAAAALLAACSKSQDNSTAGQTEASAAAAAASAAAAGANVAATAASVAASAAAAGANAASTAAGEADVSSGATAAAAATGGAALAAITLPIYPGATTDPDKSLSMSSNGTTVQVDYYLTKDDSPTVIAWYKAHLPSNWTNFSINAGPKTVGTFSTPENGTTSQTVVVTGDTDGTHVQLSTKTGS